MTDDTLCPEVGETVAMGRSLLSWRFSVKSVVRWLC